MPWSVPDAISGTGLAAAASTISRPLEKFRLAHENSPLCSRAYSPAVSFSSETNSPAERACWRRMTSARARWPGVRVVKSVAQTAPCSQSNRGRNKNSPAQSPRAAQQRPQPEKQPVPFLNAEPDPVPAGQPGKLWVTPCGAPGTKPAGLGSNCREMEPILCRGGQQTTGVTVLGREANTGPELQRVHGPASYQWVLSGSGIPGKFRAENFTPQSDALGGKGCNFELTAVNGSAALCQVPGRALPRRKNGCAGNAQFPGCFR